MTVVDREWLSSIFPDAAEREEVIADGVADICETLTILTTAVKNRVMPTIVETAHRISGVAGSIGAHSIREAAQALETGAKGGDADLAAGFEALREVVEDLCNEA
jgi:HPt (histidine-containing phosphotransfer) domain-containing protein